MKKFQKSLYNFSLMILIIFSSYIIWKALGKSSYMDFIREHTLAVDRFFLLFGTICILFLMVRLLQMLFDRLSTRGKHGLIAVISCLMVFIQLLILVFLRPQLSSDMRILFQEALALLDGKKMTAADYGAYFAHFPNNHFACIFTVFLLKIARLLHIPYGQYLLYLQIINMVFIDLSIAIAILLVTKLRSLRSAMGLLSLCLIFPMTYLLPAYYYTSTLSLPLTMGMLWLMISLKEEQNLSRELLKGGFLGILFFLAMKIRATAIILPVAFCIYLLLSANFAEKSYKKILPSLLALIVAFCICNVSYSMIQKQYHDMGDLPNSYPVTYWLMMGVEGDGTYNVLDDEFTAGFETKAEKKAATTAVFLERLKNQGISGLWKLGCKKLELTWSGGLYDYYEYLSKISSYNDMTDFVLGSRKDFFVLWMRSANILLFLLTAIGGITLIFKKETNPGYLFYLTLLGGIVFQLIWETGAIYGIPFLVFLLCCASLGNEVIPQRTSTGLAVAGVLCFLTAMIRIVPAMTQIPFENTEYVVYQDIAGDEVDGYLPLTEGSLEQSFTANRSFNRIEIGTLGGSDENTSFYRFSLLSENGELLYETTILGKEASYMTPVQFDTITPAGTKSYRILITPMEADVQNALSFLTHNTGYWDTYPSGSLKTNGQLNATADLTFTVSLTLDKPFLYI